MNPILSQIKTQYIHAQALQLNTDKAVIVESFDIVNKEQLFFSTTATAATNTPPTTKLTKKNFKREEKTKNRLFP